MKPSPYFFDRDDTLMVNVPYLGDPALTGRRFFPRRRRLWKHAAAGGISSLRGQQPVRRGARPDHARARSIRGERRAEAPAGRRVPIHAFYHSFATPDDPEATDRKPSPELLLPGGARSMISTWAARFSSATASPTSSAELNAGCRTMLAYAHAEIEPPGRHSARRKRTRRRRPVTNLQQAHYIATNLTEAAQWILEISSNVPWPKTHEIP